MDRMRKEEEEFLDRIYRIGRMERGSVHAIPPRGTTSAGEEKSFRQD